ncbi:hypothetical protein BLNAU_14203 [Blattamonas nauphoetae]|uniref:Zn(2)-C6 fungal-type domain-containing protein n=1 Tax=Blattamonas nauphoetae TaxID=2049346 RepID=A0ABQ9XEK0_9EUKA|nr:hypothetical protein BLNAU_14203 [Blattamonas nauphoetae]
MQSIQPVHAESLTTPQQPKLGIHNDEKVASSIKNVNANYSKQEEVSPFCKVMPTFCKHSETHVEDEVSETPSVPAMETRMPQRPVLHLSRAFHLCHSLARSRPNAGGEIEVANRTKTPVIAPSHRRGIFARTQCRHCTRDAMHCQYNPVHQEREQITENVAYLNPIGSLQSVCHVSETSDTQSIEKRPKNQENIPTNERLGGGDEGGGEKESRDQQTRRWEEVFEGESDDERDMNSTSETMEGLKWLDVPSSDTMFHLVAHSHLLNMSPPTRKEEKLGEKEIKPNDSSEKSTLPKFVGHEQQSPALSPTSFSRSSSLTQYSSSPNGTTHLALSFSNKNSSPVSPAQCVSDETAQHDECA